MVPVTSFFAALSALLLMALSFNVIVGRYKNKLALGDGGHPDMSRRIRAQANFAEYVPMVLILMLLSEMGGASAGFLTAMGWVLVAARISHAYSLLVFEPKNDKIIFRQIGMVSTITVIIVLAISLF